MLARNKKLEMGNFQNENEDATKTIAPMTCFSFEIFNIRAHQKILQSD
jgi:hypothetical protein